MPPPRRYAFDTRVVHAGEAPDPSTGAHGVPIYQNATFAFRSYDQVEAFETGQVPHFVYGRYGNPTVRCFELKMADLDGAEAAAAGANGMAIIGATLLQLTAGGGHLVVSSDLYSVTNEVLATDLPNQGATVTHVDITDLVAVEAAIGPETRAIYTETFSNPHLRVADVDALGDLARRRGILLAVDNTFLSPALLRPLEHGADLVLHSATKYLSGTGQVLGGVVAGRRELVSPIARRLGRLGGALSPFAAWLLLAGIKTLPLRMERHSTSAARLAVLLDTHSAVATVNFPGLPDHTGFDAARRLTGGRCGGVLSFLLRGGPAAARAFVNGLRLCTVAVSLGESSTLVWPSVGDGLIRLAVGLEDPDDLADDVAAALARVEALRLSVPRETDL